MDPRDILRETFGHADFLPGQESLTEALCAGQDVLGVMPTGGGKSVCYQVPALAREGVALVISPLISLMQDQVAALRAAGVPAAYLNTLLTPGQQELAMQRALQGAYRLIYAAPERLSVPAFRAFAARLPLSLIAVDEAHCVSQWGQDFRPDYLRIADFAAGLPVRPPMGAFTATATPRVREDIVRLLGLRSPRVVVTGFDRPNLFYEILPVRKGRDRVLLEALEELGEKSGIVYCGTRRQAESVCALLRSRGIPATRYHAGLTEEERRRNQEDFQYDRARVMAATNAFGMGIDKSNVGFVIHYQMPRSPEAYYQEAGRAGRDGSPADCLLLFSRQDIVLGRRLIRESPPNPELTPAEAAEVRRQDLRRLNAMVELCTGTGCLREAMLRYFGQTASAPCCGCARCVPGHFPRAGQAARELAEGGRKSAPAPSPSPSAASPSPSAADPAPAAGEGKELFDRLREVRLQLAAALRMPPYIVCSDRTLRDMVRRLPLTPAALREVYGMGARKVEQYGGAFLPVLRAWAEGRGLPGEPPEEKGEPAPSPEEDKADMEKGENPGPQKTEADRGKGEIPSPEAGVDRRKGKIPGRDGLRQAADALASVLSPEDRAAFRRGWLQGTGLRALAERFGLTPEEAALLLLRLDLIG